MLLARLGHDVARRRPRRAAERHAVDPLHRPQRRRPARSLGTARSRCSRPARPRSAASPSTSATPARSRPVKHHAGVDLVVAPRRYVLDAILAEAAVAAGATVRIGVHVTRRLTCRRRPASPACGATTADGSGRARRPAGVGADGLRSRVARSVGAETIDARAHRGATHYAYYAGPTWTAIEFFVGRPGARRRSSRPTTARRASGSACPPTRPSPSATRPATRPARSTRCCAAPLPSSPRGSRATTRPRRCAARCGLPNHVRQAHGPGWALVGDAGYHRDPITGHGISDAFRDAELLADAAATMSCAASATRPTPSPATSDTATEHAAGDLRASPAPSAQLPTGRPVRRAAAAARAGHRRRGDGASAATLGRPRRSLSQPQLATAWPDTTTAAPPPRNTT